LGTKLALEGRDLGEEGLKLAVELTESPRAEAFLVAMASGEVAGLFFMIRIADRRPFSLLLSLKILIVVARYPSHHSSISKVLERIDLDSLEADWGEELVRLRAVIGG
jgi:hypothetical protein